LAADPITKAKGVAQLAAGASVRDVAETLKVSKTTVQKWADEVKEHLGKSAAEIKQQTFTDAYESFMISVMDMLKAHAHLLSDPDYIRNTKEGLLAHTEFITSRAERFIQLQRNQPASALPERVEHVEAELVE
jgi:nucleoside-diphosphate-sugar epimerase